MSTVEQAQAPWRLDPTHSLASAEASIAPGGWYALVKAVGDFTCALVILILTAPLIVLSAALIKLTSRGPVFYSQVRLGRNGRPFTIYKLRSMQHRCESLTGAQWCQPGDARVTLIGRFLRRTHLDELPQLWNVLRFDMSLIGPRPERPEFVPQLERAIPLYRDRLLVRPGITGLAQIQLPPDTTVASVRRKLAHDIYYIRKMGLWLDVRIAVATVLGLVGLPVGATRFVLALPGGRPVEQAYERDVAELHVNGKAELQWA